MSQIDNLNRLFTRMRVIGLVGASASVLGLALACHAQNEPGPGPAPESRQVDSAASEAPGSGRQSVVYDQGPNGQQLNLLIWGAGAPGPARPVTVLFHGGAFVAGSAEGFSKMCEDIASQSIACVSVNYTLRGGEHQLQEAKAAVAWVRGHAAELHVDPNRIIVGGGSAGGYLALSTAVLAPARESMPDGLVLFNPVLVWRGGAGPSEDLSGDTGRLPPMMVFHGTADQTSPYPNIQAFVAAAKSTGAHADLESFPGRRHGFFNYGGGNNADYYTVTKSVIQFAKSGQAG